MSFTNEIVYLLFASVAIYSSAYELKRSPLFTHIHESVKLLIPTSFITRFIKILSETLWLHAVPYFRGRT